MDIDSNLLKKELIKIKESITNTLDRAKQNKVRSVLIANIGIVEQFLMWIAKIEKEGAIDMESLKIGLGKTVKLSDIQKEIGSRSKLDQAIIEEAAHLKDGELGDGRLIDRTKISNLTYFKNRVYQLSREGRIHTMAAPKETKEGLYIWLTEKKKGRQKVSK